jgi:hypothetical protein
MLFKRGKKPAEPADPAKASLEGPPAPGIPPAGPPAPGIPTAPPTPGLPRVGELVYFYIDGHQVAKAELMYIPEPSDIVSIAGIDYHVLNRMWMTTPEPVSIAWVSVNLVMMSIDIAQAERERLMQ